MLIKAIASWALLYSFLIYTIVGSQTCPSNSKVSIDIISYGLLSLSIYYVICFDLLISYIK